MKLSSLKLSLVLPFSNIIFNQVDVIKRQCKKEKEKIFISRPNWSCNICSIMCYNSSFQAPNCLDIHSLLQVDNI